MRATITIPDCLLAELVERPGTDDPTQAIAQAIEGYVRHAEIQRLIAMRGRVAIADEDEIESWDARDLASAGELSRDLRQRGRTLASLAGLIATLALRHGVPLLPADGDVDAVPGLRRHPVDAV